MVQELFGLAFNIYNFPITFSHKKWLWNDNNIQYELMPSLYCCIFLLNANTGVCLILHSYLEVKFIRYSPTQQEYKTASKLCQSWSRTPPPPHTHTHTSPKKNNHTTYFLCGKTLASAIMTSDRMEVMQGKTEWVDEAGYLSLRGTWDWKDENWLLKSLRLESKIQAGCQHTSHHITLFQFFFSTQPQATWLQFLVELFCLVDWQQ